MKKGLSLSLLKAFGALGLSLLVVVSSAATATQPQGKDKLKPEEVAAKNLEAIGSAEARAATKTMIAVGTVEATFRGTGVVKISGTSLLASEGDKNLLSLRFNSSQYPYERIGFNGEKVTGVDITPGSRSPLINFLLGYDTIIKQGLLGGTLSTAWPLLHLSERNSKLELAGLKKMGGRQVYELRYLPRKGSDISISLFFDAETFRHVRTEYSKSIAGPIGATPEASPNAGTATRYKMVEEFGDFKQEGKLTLPHDYKLSLVIANVSNSTSLEWTMKFTKFIFNQAIDEKEFSMS